MNPILLNLYGNYRTKTFTDLYEDFDDFKADYGVALPKTIRDTDPVSPATTENSLKTLYYLLYARYGNSHIASSDENQFKMKLQAIIYQYGPTWEKQLDTQKAIRELTEDEIKAGSTVRYYKASNPTEGFAIGEDVDYINDQTTQMYNKSPLDGYNNLMLLLRTDVTGNFLAKFRSLFLTVVNPELPLWYVSEEE